MLNKGVEIIIKAYSKNLGSEDSHPTIEQSKPLKRFTLFLMSLIRD